MITVGDADIVEALVHSSGGKYGNCDRRGSCGNGFSCGNGDNAVTITKNW